MFSIHLKELRESRGLSQRAFASEFGVSPAAIGMWESGERQPRHEMLRRIADYFDVSIDYLLGNAEQKEKPIPVSEDGLSAEQLELINLFETAPPALRAAALAVLRSSEAQGKAPDGVSKAE